MGRPSYLTVIHHLKASLGTNLAIDITTLLSGVGVQSDQMLGKVDWCEVTQRPTPGVWCQQTHHLEWLAGDDAA